MSDEKEIEVEEQIKRLVHNREQDHKGVSRKGDYRSDTSAEYKYRQKAKEKLLTYIIGNKDVNGSVIEKVFSRGDDYVIYKITKTPADKSISHTIRVEIETLDENDEHKRIDNFQEIRGDFNNFRSIVHLSDDVILSMQQASHAIAAGIQGKIVLSKGMFKELTDDIIEGHKERLKYNSIFLSVYLLISALMSVVAFLIYYNRTTITVSQNITAFYLISMGTFGIYGGLISISTKIKTISFKYNAETWQITLYAIERASYSFLFGVLGYLLVKNDILMSFVQNIEHPEYGFMIASCIAGISEKFIPDKLAELQSNN